MFELRSTTKCGQERIQYVSTSSQPDDPNVRGFPGSELCVRRPDALHAPASPASGRPVVLEVSYAMSSECRVAGVNERAWRYIRPSQDHKNPQVLLNRSLFLAVMLVPPGVCTKDVEGMSSGIKVKRFSLS